MPRHVVVVADDEVNNMVCFWQYNGMSGSITDRRLLETTTNTQKVAG